MSVYTPNARGDHATTATRRPRARRVQDPRRHRRDRSRSSITDEDYIQFVLRMSDKEPYDPVPLTFKFYLTELDDAVRRLQPARLQPAAAVQDAALEDRPARTCPTCTRSTTARTR